MTESRDRSTSSRRDFLRLAAAAGIAGALSPAAALAQSPTPAPTPPAAPPAPPTPAVPEAPSEAARSLTAILQQRLGRDRLTDAQWESVTRDFDGDLAVGKRFSAIKLANGDEPDFTFKVTP